MDSESHTFELSLEIHQVCLSVRFPCSLTFQLKADSNVVESSNSFQLVNGRCTPKETLKVEFSLEKLDDTAYRAKQIKLVILMNSSNGKIPAGSLTFDTSSLKTGVSVRKEESIQKCPDKFSLVDYTVNLEYLRVGRVGSDRALMEIATDYDKSLVRSRIEGLRTNRTSFKELERKVTSARNRINIPEHDSQDNHRKGEQRERSQQMKNIIRMKTELHGSQTEETSGLLRQELGVLMKQNERAREKIRLLERKEKQHLQTIRDLKEQVEKKKDKNNQQEFIRMQSQALIDERQKIIKEMQGGLKKYEEEISDLKMNLSTQQKRIEFKQSNLKDQLSKLSAKHQQSEGERQKAINELNKMLEELERVEKKNQVQIKEKDRIHAEEKNKLVKSIEGLHRSLEAAKENLDQKETIISDFQREIKQLQAKLKQSEDEILEIRGESKGTATALSREQNQKKNLQKRLYQLEQAQVQHKELRKRYKELENKESSGQRSLEVAGKNIQILQAKNRELTESLQKKGFEISALEAKLANQMSEIERLRRDDDSLAREVQALSASNLAAASKTEELKGKLDQLQMAYNQLEATSEEQLSYLIKSKQYLEADMEEWKESCERLRYNLEQMSKNSSQQQDQILQANKQRIAQQEHSSKLEEQIADLKSTIRMVNQEKDLTAAKEQQALNKLKAKSDQAHELQKKISKLQSNSFMLEEKMRHLEQYLTEKIQTEEAKSKSKDTDIANANDTISKLELELLESREKANSQANELKRLLKEISYLKDQQGAVRLEKDDQEKHIESLQESIKSFTEQIEVQNQELLAQKESRKQLMKTMAKNKKEADDFRLAANQAMEQLLIEMGRQGDRAQDKEIFAFPNQQLAALAIETLKKRRSAIQKNSQQLQSLQNHISFLEEEAQKTRQRSDEREEELEEMIAAEKNKIKNLISETTEEKTHLLESIGQLEDSLHELTAECDHLNIEMKEYKSAIQELETALTIKTNELDKLQSDIASKDQNFSATRESHETEIAHLEEQLKSLKTEQAFANEKSKKALNEVEKKVQVLEKTLEEREEVMAKLESNLSEIVYQRDNKEQLLRQMNSRYSDLIQEHKQSLQANRDTGKVSKRAQARVLELEAQLAHQGKKIEEIMSQKTKTEQELSKQIEQGAKARDQIEDLKERLQVSQTLLKENASKSKGVSERDTIEMKRMREEIITLNSDLELKVFLISQLEESVKNLKSAIAESQQEVAQRKAQIVSLQSKVQDLKNENILINQSVDQLRSQNQSLQEQTISLKEALMNTEQHLQQAEGEAATQHLLERQINKLKEEAQTKEKQYEKTYSEFKTQIGDLKKQITSRGLKEQEYKKVVRDLEKQIEEQSYDIEAERKDWEENSNDERKKLLAQVTKLQEENKLLTAEFENERQQLNKELDQYDMKVKQLTESIQSLSNELNDGSKKLSTREEKVSSLQQELKKCKQEWAQEKTRYLPTSEQFVSLQSELTRHQRHSADLQAKIKQLLEVGRRRLAGETKIPTIDVLREVSTAFMRNKARMIAKCSTEKEKEALMGDLKAIQQKLDWAIRSQGAR